MHLALWPAAPAVWHSPDKLDAELVQRAVKTIVRHIEAERADLAARGLEEQFDAEHQGGARGKMSVKIDSGSYTPQRFLYAEVASRERWAEQGRCAYWDSNCRTPSPPAEG